MTRSLYFNLMRKLIDSCLMGFLLIVYAASAHAAAVPESLGKFGFWTAYKIDEDGQPLCYMSITAHPQPPKQKTKVAKRGAVTLMITHRPSENNNDVFSYSSGTKFKPASEVNVTVGAKHFNLFTQGDAAWSRDAATDHALAAAIRNGQTITVTGVSAHDTPINDTLYLKGASEAYRSISKSCGFAVEEPKMAPAHKKTQAKSKR